MKNGFTLIELIATIMIILILALFITPKVIKISDDSRQKGYKEIEKRLEEAAAKYILDNYVDSSTTSMTITDTMLIDGNYIDAIEPLGKYISSRYCSATVDVTNLNTTPIFTAHLTCDDYTS